MKATALFAIFAALTWNFAEGPNKSASTHKQKVAQEPTGNPAPITVVVQNNPGSQPAGGTTPKPPGGDTAPQWVLVFVGIATCGVIGWQSLETRRAAQAARDSVRLSRESMVLTHRPKIIVRSVVVPWMAILNRHTPMNAGDDLDDGQLGGFFYAVNVGNQPAILQSLDEFMFFNDNLPMERPYESGQNRRALGITVQPGASYKISLTPKQTHSLELAVVAVSESPFVVGGRLVYADTLGNHRETAFCRRVDHKLGRLVVVNDPEYEYAD